MGTQCSENLAAPIATLTDATSPNASLPLAVQVVESRGERGLSSLAGRDAALRSISNRPGDASTWLTLSDDVHVAVAEEPGAQEWTLSLPNEADAADHPRLRFESMLRSRGSWSEVQVRVDDQWLTVRTLHAGSAAETVDVDLEAQNGATVDVRFVFHGVAAADAPADLWRVSEVRVVEP